MMNSILAVTLIYAAVFLPADLLAADPGKLDVVALDSVAVSPGGNAEIGIRIMADDTTRFNDRTWQGVGSFCIPLKYDAGVFKVDSIQFEGVLKDWDEKFANPRFDTGFVSFAGIYSLTGKDRPTLFYPDKPGEVIRIFVTASKNAAPGVYLMEPTRDPIQKEMFLGSPDGLHSWKPQFVPGKIVVK